MGSCTPLSAPTTGGVQCGGQQDHSCFSAEGTHKHSGDGWWLDQMILATSSNLNCSVIYPFIACIMSNSLQQQPKVGSKGDEQSFSRLLGMFEDPKAIWAPM